MDRPQVRVENEGVSGTSPFLYVLFAIIVAIVSVYFYPQIKSAIIGKERQALENKIENAESFYDEAKALSLSMPLLSDSVVFTVADSLMITIIDLNRTWVIFVSTQEGFETYTPEVENLNNDIDELRLEYEVAKVFRGIMNLHKESQRQQRQWIEKKKKTFV